MAINYLDLMDLHHDTLHMLNIFKAKYQPIIIGVHLVHMIHTCIIKDIEGRMTILLVEGGLAKGEKASRMIIC